MPLNLVAKLFCMLGTHSSEDVISILLVAGEAPVKAERSEFVLNLDGRRSRP